MTTLHTIKKFLQILTVPTLKLTFFRFFFIVEDLTFSILGLAGNLYFTANPWLQTLLLLIFGHKKQHFWGWTWDLFVWGRRVFIRQLYFLLVRWLYHLAASGSYGDGFSCHHSYQKPNLANECSALSATC